MPKRVRFSEENLVSEKITKFEDEEKPSSSKVQASLPGSRFKENHSIDSDDEDEEKQRKEDQFKKLTEEDVEGAENEEMSGDYSEDGGPIITPFNLREEMAEGSFDKDGHYHFKKEKEIRDNWLDNIDWGNVKKAKEIEDNRMSDEDDIDKEQFDEIKTIEGIVQLLKKGETVSKGLRRLGGSDSNKKKNKSKSWKREKVYDLEMEDDDAETSKVENKEEETKKSFLQLTELADQMAGAGYYDIYTDSFEKLQHKLNSMQMSEKVKTPDVSDAADADDALDIFADDIDSKELEKPTPQNTTDEQTNGNDDNDDSVKWEYKWNNKETQVFGPFTSTQMAQWKEQGYFKDGVQVRRLDRPDAAYYSVGRIDFDLYD